MNLISLFTGCMGLDLGLEASGFKTILAIENDPNAQATIKANRPDLPLLSDVTQASPEAVRTAAGLSKDSTLHILSGGCPCQAWSTAGHRRGTNDPRGRLLTSYLDIIEELKPLYVVIENVRGILCTQGGKPFYNLVQEFQSLGYHVSFNLYNAANFGTPQIRERIIIIASLHSKVPYLTPTHDKLARFNLKPWTTFREATTNLPEGHADKAVPIPSTNLKYFKLLKPGQNWKNLPPELQKEALRGTYDATGGKTGCLRRLAWNAPSPTILTYPMQKLTNLVHPEENRALSIAEYKRLQDFPDDWIIKGNRLSQYKQVGNAVPVLLAKAAGITILNHLHGISPTTIPGFKHSRFNDTCENKWAGGITGDLFD